MTLVTLAADDNNIGQRIDVFISNEIEDMSRSSAKKIIDNGGVNIFGKAVKSNYKLKNSDIVTIYIPEAETLEAEPENIPIDILYEDNDVVVVNKPQGMVVHPAAGHYTGTLVNALLYHCELSEINGVLRPGIVHRIDKDTSGVLMVAKNNKAHLNLSEQLAVHSITRIYNAIVFNNVKCDSGTVDKPIARNPNDRKKMAIVNGGRRAVTHYKVLERLGKFTFIEAQLETGRTHQIRVHMSSIGHPLLGDYVYGPKNQPIKLSGQALHAKVLGFIHPSTGKYMEFEAPIPEYFEKALIKVRNLK